MKFLLVALFALSAMIFPQELNCTINVNMDNIPVSNRDLLSDFSQQLTNYMNRTHFTQQDWGYDKINCGMNIFILTASTSGSFSAQVVITSQRPVYQSTKNSLMLSINDPNWSFNYQKGQPLISNQASFDPVTSFLDFYANLIIGFDADSWTLYGGSQYFNKAYSIANLSNGTNFTKGWSIASGYTRMGLVQDLVNDKYRPFREAFYQYYYGIDIFDKNKKIGQEKIVYLITTLASLADKIDFNSLLLKTFFDAKSGEIVDYLKDYPDKSIFKVLMKIDPSHNAKYDAAIGS